MKCAGAGQRWQKGPLVFDRSSRTGNSECRDCLVPEKDSREGFPRSRFGRYPLCERQPCFLTPCPSTGEDERCWLMSVEYVSTYVSTYESTCGREYEEGRARRQIAGVLPFFRCSEPSSSTVVHEHLCTVRSKHRVHTVHCTIHAVYIPEMLCCAVLPAPLWL